MTPPELPDEATLVRYLEMLYRALVEIRMLASLDNPRVAQLADAVHAVPRQLGRWSEMREGLLLDALERYEGRYPGGAGRFSALLREEARERPGREVARPEEDPLAVVRALLDTWCERRALGPLSRVLPAWMANDGLPGGRAALRDALRAVHAHYPDLPPDELESLARVERALGSVMDA